MSNTNQISNHTQELLNEVAEKFGTKDIRSKELMEYSIPHYRAVRRFGRHKHRGAWALRRVRGGKFVPAQSTA